MMGVKNFFKKKKTVKTADDLEDGIEKKENKSLQLNETSENLSKKIEEEMSPKKLTSIEKNNIKKSTKEECRGYIREYCQRIVEANQQINEAKIEYQVVTSYLVDIQKIEQMPKEERGVLDDAARNLLTLTRERNQYQNNTIRTSDKRFYGIKRYENEMVLEIKKLRDMEDYDRKVKNDMRYLEGEKGELVLQQKEIAQRQRYLKKMSVWISTLIFFLVIVLFGISYAFKSDMTLPILLTIIVVAVSIMIIFWEAKENKHKVVLLDKKIGKAINLLNKVKIKYVNNTSVLEYGCNKFGVKNSSELQYVWEEYLKAREEEQRYQTNTDRLHYYRQILVKELEKSTVVDTEIWLYQVAALIDNKEMVEIRHKLNVRRQKLRERVEYNSKLRDNSFEGIHGIIIRRADLKEDTVEILRQYEISLI